MKKAQYFMIDVILALTVLAVGFLLFLAPKSYTASTDQSAVSVHDAVRVASLPAGNIPFWQAKSGCFAGEGCSLEDCDCLEPLAAHVRDESVFAAATRFVREGQKGLASALAEAVIGAVVPGQYGYNVSLLLDEPVLLASRGRAVTSHAISGRAVAYFINQSMMLEGPYVTQVIVWQ
jgi:hypothetical protein